MRGNGLDQFILATVVFLLSNSDVFSAPDIDLQAFPLPRDKLMACDLVDKVRMFVHPALPSDDCCHSGK